MIRLTIGSSSPRSALPTRRAQRRARTEGSISGPGFRRRSSRSLDGRERQGALGRRPLTQSGGLLPGRVRPVARPDAAPQARAARAALHDRLEGADGNGAPDHIRQDLYPYARGGAVTYTRPGQPIFDMTTRGGWYRDPELKRTLVRLGLPAERAERGSDGQLDALAGLAAAVARRGSGAPVLRAVSAARGRPRPARPSCRPGRGRRASARRPAASPAPARARRRAAASRSRQASSSPSPTANARWIAPVGPCDGTTRPGREDSVGSNSSSTPSSSSLKTPSSTSRRPSASR